MVHQQLASQINGHALDLEVLTNIDLFVTAR